MNLTAVRALVALFLLSSCGSDSPTENGEAPLSGSLAFVNVSVVSMVSEEPVVVPGRTVLVDGDRIVDVVDAAVVDLDPDTEVIDGTGRFLVPGLIDMHTHIRGRDLQAYLDHGVTSVRNLWGYEGLQQTARDILTGELAGPAIYSISPGLDGSPPSWPQTQLIGSVAEADVVVQKQVDDGWTGLKMYQNLRSDVFDAVVAAANERDLPFGGHVPHRVGLLRCLEAGYRHIEHLSGYELILGTGTRGYPGWYSIDSSRVPELVTATQESGTWNCPTLAIFRALASNRSATQQAAVRDNRRAFVSALREAGCGLLIGTDSGIDVVSAGSSMHDEMDEFRGSGFSNYQTLRLATFVAAGYLGLSDEVGTVESGKRADLLLLETNPVDDPDAPRNRVGVLVRGEWLPAP